MSLWEINYAPSSGFPSWSGYISLYIPPLVIIQIKSGLCDSASLLIYCAFRYHTCDMNIETKILDKKEDFRAMTNGSLKKNH